MWHFKWPSANANYASQNAMQTVACLGKSKTLQAHSRFAKLNRQLFPLLGLLCQFTRFVDLITEFVKSKANCRTLLTGLI